MYGRSSAYDADSRTIANIDAGSFQIDSRVAAGDGDLLVECAAHPVITIIADCSIILIDVRNLFTHGKVNRIERRHFRGEGRGKGGPGVIHLYLAEPLFCKTSE